MYYLSADTYSSKAVLSVAFTLKWQYFLSFTTGSVLEKKRKYGLYSGWTLNSWTKNWVFFHEGWQHHMFLFLFLLEVHHPALQTETKEVLLLGASQQVPVPQKDSWRTPQLVVLKRWVCLTRLVLHHLCVVVHSLGLSLQVWIHP